MHDRTLTLLTLLGVLLMPACDCGGSHAGDLDASGDGSGGAC